MILKPGQRLRSRTSECELIVIRAPAGEVDITIAGAAPLQDGEVASDEGTRSATESDAVQVGKRLVDASDSLEVLCVRAGLGPASVGGVPLENKAAKALPSSD